MPNEIEETRGYIKKVYDAFNHHCDEIEKRTLERLRAEDDDEKRQEILKEQKEELDKTLAELKSILSQKTRELREKLETMEQEKNEEEFNLDAQLAEM